jgi:hypothetical protein
MEVKIPKEVSPGIRRRVWTGGQLTKYDRCAQAPLKKNDSKVIYLYGCKNPQRGVTGDQQERLDRRAANQIQKVHSYTTVFI